MSERRKMPIAANRSPALFTFGGLALTGVSPDRYRPSDTVLVLLNDL